MTGVKRRELDDFLCSKHTGGNGLQVFVDKLRTHHWFWHFEMSEMYCPTSAKSVPFRPVASSYEEEESQGGDPYLLNGNTATIRWPLDNGSVPSFTGTIRYARPGRKRCYEVAFEDGDVRLSALIGKRMYMVTASDHLPGPKWTERERQALFKRCLATPHAEPTKSIACSLARSETAVSSHRRKYSSADYERPSGASHATTGFKIGYRKRLQEVMLSLPDQRGTLSQIWTEFERLPQVFLVALLFQSRALLSNYSRLESHC